MESRVRSRPFSEEESVSHVGEPLSYPQDIPPAALMNLSYAIDRQARVQTGGEFNEILHNPIEGFRNHPLCRELQEDAMRVMRDTEEGRTDAGKNPYSENDFRVRFRGKIMEELGYSVLSSIYESGDRVIISPDETLSYYKNLHPRVGIKRNYFQRSLDGIYTPDGLMIDPKTRRITNILEYTTSLATKREDQIRSALFHTSHSANILLKSAKIAVVFPDQSISKETRRKFSDVELIKLPFSLADVVKLEESMFYALLSELGIQAEPEHIASFFKSQAARYLEKESTGKLTKEWRKYAERNRKVVEFVRRYGVR